MNINFEPLSSAISSQDLISFKNKYKINMLNVNILQWLLILSMPLLMFVMTGIILSNKNNSTIGLAGTIAITFSIIIFACLMYYSYVIRKLKYNIRLSRFAEVNGLVFEPEVRGADLNYPGMYFQTGKSHIYRERLRSQTGNLFEISNFSYTVSGGSSNQTLEKGYVMIKLDRKLPNIVLDSNANNYNSLGFNVSNLPVKFKDNQKLALEGDFNSYFTLYVPVGYERDALYVFTPDLMSLFIDNSSVFDAEIIDDRLFIYSNRFDLTSSVTLDRIFKIIETVGAKTLSQTDYYTDERIGNRASDIVSVSGSRLKKQFVSVGVVVSIIIFILIIML